MKTTIINNKEKLVFALPVLFLFITLGCQEPFSPLNNNQTPSGMGSFSLQIAEVNARTILPNTTQNDFAAYRLMFVGEQIVQEDRTAANYGSMVYLPIGTYNLTVTAYLDAEMEKPAAQGYETGITIGAGTTAYRSITLRALIGTDAGSGTFAWAITFPSGVTAASMKITPIGAGGTPETSVNLLGAEDKNGSLTLNSGYYQVLFTFEMPDVKTLEWLEALHIYQNLESRCERNFTGAYFNSNIYTVTFNYNYSGKAIEYQSVIHGGTVTEPSPEPSRTGYDFGGWFTETAMVSYNFSTPVINNLSLIAKWDINAPLANLEDIAVYLNTAVGALENPVFLPVNIELGDMTSSASNWQQLLTIINTAGKYVAIDLSGSTMTVMNGVFNPASSVSTGKSMIVSLILPVSASSIVSGISTITQAFRNFSNLRTVYAQKITSIGNYAFYGCTSLTGVSFPAATSIGNYGTFYGCTSLTSVDIPAAVTNIGGSIFYNCTSLTSVNFPEATSIGEAAFYNCTSLTSVNFPEANYIGNTAFYRCTSLTNVSIPKANYIGSNAFQDCTSLTSVNFPEATSIGEAAFYNCTSLTSVNFPEADYIGNTAFYRCTSLTNVSFPKATSIGSGAFAGCTSLTSVSFLATATIDETSSPFGECTSLTSFNLIGAGSLSVIESGKALVRNGNELLAYPSASDNIVLNTITSIAGYVFSGCTNLTSVSFPVATNIGDGAFYNCTSLTSVDIPEATSIGTYAFYNCTSLTSVSFPAATSISNYTFSGCTSLTGVSFPVATSIVQSAFSGCTSLTGVSFPVVTSIGQSVFSGCNSLTSISLAANCNINATGSTRFLAFRTYYLDASGGNQQAGTYTWDGSSWVGP